MIILLQVVPVHGIGQLLKLAVVEVCLINFDVLTEYFRLLFKYFTPKAGRFETLQFLIVVHHVRRILACLLACL